MSGCVVTSTERIKGGSHETFTSLDTTVPRAAKTVFLLLWMLASLGCARAREAGETAAPVEDSAADVSDAAGDLADDTEIAASDTADAAPDAAADYADAYAADYADDYAADYLELEPEPDEAEPGMDPVDRTREPPGEVPAENSEAEGESRADGPLVTDTKGEWLDAGNPDLVELFYGTDRARHEPVGKLDVRTFSLPLLAVALFFAVPALLKRFVKHRFRRWGAVAARAVSALAFVWLGMTGLAKYVQERDADALLKVRYGNDRMNLEIEERPYELGICTVNIPPVHVEGIVERPSLFHLEFRADPTKHFVLANIEPYPESEAFYKKLRARVTASAQKDLFVFVHGYANSFQDAAFRTAQIAHDLKFQGAPVFFSWPSQGELPTYTVDENEVGAAQPDLEHFLEEIVARSGAENIHVVAHSMGNRAVTQTLENFALRYREHPVFSEVVLAAPDVDVGTFRKLVAKFRRSAQRVTLYASSNDAALAASRRVHGNKERRAGESDPPVVVAGLESVDVSEVSSGHSYIAASGHILDDLAAIVMQHRKLSTEVADFIPVENAEARGLGYWRLRK